MFSSAHNDVVENSNIVFFKFRPYNYINIAIAGYTHAIEIRQQKRNRSNKLLEGKVNVSTIFNLSLFYSLLLKISILS